MSDANIDPRLAPYTAAKIDPNNPESCMTPLKELSDMVKTPQANRDVPAKDAGIKLLFPQIQANEKLIDYLDDNDKDPKWENKSSTDEWGAFMMAAAKYVAKHPEVDLTLRPNGQGPELPEATLKTIVAEGKTIFNNYEALRQAEARMEAARNLDSQIKRQGKPR